MLDLFEELPASFPNMLEVRWWANEISRILHLYVLGLKDQTKSKTQERGIIIFV